jgi:hypothetical protein
MRWVMLRLDRIVGWVRRWPVSARGLALVLVGVAAAALALRWLLGPLAWSVAGRTVTELTGKDRADAINSVRQIVLAGAAGVLAVGGLAFTARNYYLARRGQVTDRYTKAIALLASTEIAERIGGVYALEHVLRESPVDHTTVVDVLAAFIRDRAPGPPTAPGPPPAQSEPTPDTAGTRRERPRLPADVQAALTVLARRPDRPEPNPLDLRHTDLSGAELTNARLNHALLTESRLQDANLAGAQLQGAHLFGAQLQRAGLTGARLQRANLAATQLQRAQLEGAQLQGVLLQGAQLVEAQLQGAQLERAQLRSVILAGAHLQGVTLAAAQLRGAYLAGAQLQGADLAGAHLQDADLADADLTQVRGLQRHQLLAATWPDDAPPILDERHRSWLPEPTTEASARPAE